MDTNKLISAIRALFCKKSYDLQKISNLVLGGGGNSNRLGYGMCHFLRVLFGLKNKFLGLFYSF